MKKQPFLLLALAGKKADIIALPDDLLQNIQSVVGVKFVMKDVKIDENE